ncbi:hypothetical protein CH063_03458 [Colletotrichum higginsianum]|uniref:EC19 protein n=2 Tax=Colletotrichum higginsianum TaxID=80884 RepID=H1VXE8_COLHI|nr:EC19 protein [Colletotrichum higginsianum IMI 349063]OBR04181.1 EC19 protein [Colletotrichum higginsianum IMI 349063]TIC90157.1 hypothetical protein CH35J_012162 [Colletotrichum higginsianum]CCF44910.1 hypothetical protein CH063_03458 [Colletotrichum higginsianum]CCF70894.1 EC19 protein [Colletotrichum higginsianum]
MFGLDWKRALIGLLLLESLGSALVLPPRDVAAQPNELSAKSRRENTGPHAGLYIRDDENKNQPRQEPPPPDPGNPPPGNPPPGNPPPGPPPPGNPPPGPPRPPSRDWDDDDDDRPGFPDDDD